MRLVRYGERGRERPGVLDSQGSLRDLSGVLRDIDGAALMPEGLDRLRGLDLEGLPEIPPRSRNEHADPRAARGVQ
jgi:2,4-diketo-3-deoxy-L-fuconate hydrolase